MRVSIGYWLIECDPEATRRGYAKMPWGHDCDCAPCRNLDALGPAAFPPAVREILERLGIDFCKPAEVYHTARLASGLHLYGGWYHCVGRIESGPETGQTTTPGGATEAFPSVTGAEHFRLWCSSHRDLVPEPLRDLPVVQVDFAAELPWVLPETEPD